GLCSSGPRRCSWSGRSPTSRSATGGGRGRSPSPGGGGGGGGVGEGQKDERPPAVPKKVTPKPTETVDPKPEAWVAGEPTVFKGHGTAVMSVAFAADGKGARPAAADQTVRRWDPDTGKEAEAARMTFRSEDAFILSPDG